MTWVQAIIESPLNVEGSLFFWCRAGNLTAHDFSQLGVSMGVICQVMQWLSQPTGVGGS